MAIMNRSRVGIGMSSRRGHIVLLAVINFVALSSAGPLGPLPNVTSSDMGLNEGSCALGDVVYMPGDEFPGTTPCEKCTCAGGGVHCEKQRCEPRPGCKALHRPDHCCPTYQCECEQEGRVYGNGEKLVDPADPCRVCYCQGGEVVCRRIACFLRDDCSPRLVPGRCCPEYDNCPLRGVTALPGVTSSGPSIPVEEIDISAAPPAPKENIKQKITIKEITPVSEIPVITEVKIKEILPSPSIEVAEYLSSKSPLIPREATSEKSVKSSEGDKLFLYSGTESPTIIEVHSAAPALISSPQQIKITDNTENKDEASKISFSTQDSINSDIYSNVPIATMGSPPITPEPIIVASTTKAPIIEEEDLSLLDHNPAFPPLPDDLSVLSNHGDELVPEPTLDSELLPLEVVHVSAPPSTEAEVKLPITTNSKDLPITTIPTEKASEASTEASTSKTEVLTTTVENIVKESLTPNLRSAIPTEIMSISSYVPEEITNGSEHASDTTASSMLITSTTTEANVEVITEKAELSSESSFFSSSTSGPEIYTSTHKVSESREDEPRLKDAETQTTDSMAKSNVAPELTSPTELSSLPIETSDQNPHEEAEKIAKEKITTSTEFPFTTSSNSQPSSSEVITVSSLGSNENAFEGETTEFILTSFGSSETATDAVELIKISGNSEKSAAIIESSPGRKNNVLTELINLVSDVATMSEHTDSSDNFATVTATNISDSEELIPVNAGYKSKNSNRNLNSITEIPPKGKNQAPGTKQKVIEIEDDDTDNITDSQPPNDKVEPTTRRPIIDNVSDDNPENKTEEQDIEIINKTFVPTVNRPTKVVMKKNNEKPQPDEDTLVSAFSETASESNFSSEFTTLSPEMEKTEAAERIEASSNATWSSPQ